MIKNSTMEKNGRKHKNKNPTTSARKNHEKNRVCTTRTIDVMKSLKFSGKKK